MASTSWGDQRKVRDALQAIVADPDLGAAALSSKDAMTRHLPDLLPGAELERKLLVAAAEAGLAQILQDRVKHGMDVATASSLTASEFAVQTARTREASDWVVGELAAALGLASADSRQDTSPGPPPADGITPGERADKLRPEDETLDADTGSGKAGGGTGTRPSPGGDQGRTVARRRVPLALIGTAVVVVAALIAGIVLLTGHHPAPAASVKPVSQIVRPDVTSCHAGAKGNLRGTVQVLDCPVASPSITFYAIQFDSKGDYLHGITQVNANTGFDPAMATGSCKPPVLGTTIGINSWFKENYPTRTGQNFECYTDNHHHPAILWTFPTQRALLWAEDSSSSATLNNLINWWESTSYN